MTSHALLASVYEEMPFFLETELTNRETIIAPIADSSPIVGFRGREAYEVSEYAIIQFGNNQFV